MNDLSIVVFGCDLNSENNIKGFIHYWKKYWTENYPQYWIKETTERIEGFNCIAINDPCFSDRIIKTLSILIQSKYILFLLDDYWAFRSLPNGKIEHIIKVMNENDIVCCNICNDFGRDIYDSEIEGLKRYKDSINKFNYQAAIWERETLLKIVVKDEDPWKSEINGIWRLKNMPENNKIYNLPYHWYANAYLKGKLAPEGQKMLNEI